MIDEKKKNPFEIERESLVESIRSEFVGSLEENDQITENPVTRYAAGMIFPNNYERRRDEPSTGDQILDSEKESVVAEEVEIENPGTGSANSFFPSVLGISFFCSGKNPKLSIEAKWTTYNKLENEQNYIEVENLPELLTEQEDFKENFEIKDGKLYANKILDFSVAKSLSEKIENKALQAILYKAVIRSRGTWANSIKTETIIIDPEFKSKKIAEGLELVCNRKSTLKSDSTLYTIALRNVFPACDKGMDEEHVFFDVSINVTSAESNKNIFTEYASSPLFNDDEEEQSLALLYRNRKTYAVGHGCAANWELKNEEINAQTVFTEALPTYEVPQTNFEISGLDSLILSMRELSGEGSLRNKDIINKLEEFCNLYKSWIAGLESNNDLPPTFLKIASKHINLCKEAHARMVEGVKALANDEITMESFKLANKAMFMQSLHSELQKQKRLPQDNPIVWPNYSSDISNERKWRPFQLGFLLLSIKGTIDSTSVDREIVDLVWFPTGGGKTEAYLGLSSFTIFYRRLKNESKKGGTTVMMRYTLRLLTAQQFQRACTLICAMEKLRKENPTKLGNEEISIGLWVGLSSTPNNLVQAEKDFQSFIFGDTDKNPSPILSCPWCGTKMIIEKLNGRRDYGYKKKTSPAQANLFCLERSCDFSQRLPILIVDEEIYRDSPTLLFGTVDKFAQMPLQKGVAKIFAADKDNSNLPPELIIQDELHLISGALGTMVGIYETAVDFLCSRKGIKPKIVASTATVRRAADQCRNLFNREMRQFPSPGIEINDSFFSKETSLDTRPGRLYVGLMPSGKTQTTAAVRLTAKLLYSVFASSSDEEVKDKYWTLIAYFNSIRELGGFISLINDDIPLYANALKQRYGGEMRHIYVPKELTSRKLAEEIPEILEQLSISFPDRNAIDILAATNMISVGVDIDRLGLMVIRGQPKLTSEYIQVSSRIGRRYPGLVVTLYNSARTRDRAHYERFRSYHESFYRNVEPSSVTPFSAPARARALSAVLITMFRHGLSADFDEESGAGLFTPDIEGIKDFRDYIYERVKSIDSTEADATLEEFDSLLKEWKAFKLENDSKIVYKNDLHGIPLVRKNEGSRKGLWLLPTSMRNVDAECNIEIKDE